MKRTIGQVFKQRRLKLAMSQKEVAEKAQVDRVTYNMIESGKRGCTPKSMRKICNVLGFNYDNAYYKHNKEYIEWKKKKEQEKNIKD